MAAAAGDADVHRTFVARSKNYKNVWDAGAEFMCPRSSAGAFQCSFDPSMPFIADKHYTEGNAWQWTWAVWPTRANSQ